MRKSKPQKGSTKPVAKDFLDGLKSWQLHSLCLLILFVTPLILQSPVFFDGKIIASNDIIQWRAGAESLIEYRNETGEQAQWATNMFAGMPAYVISNLQKFPHFDTLIVPLFKGLFPLIEYWILLGGAYFFLLVMGYRPLVSVVGAILIGMTTYVAFIVTAGHNTKFIAYSYIPWVFAGYKLMSQGDKKLLAGFALFLLAFLLHVRAGHPQVTYYFLFLLGGWWIFDGFDAYKSSRTTQWLQSTGLLVIAGVLALLSVVEQYWSLYSYSPYSIRGGSDIGGQPGLDQDYAFVWSQGWAELLTLIMPNLYGGSTLYWGPKPFTSGPHYFGAIGVIFMLIGVFVARKSHLKVFLTVGILAALFSLGKHFGALNNAMFDYFPLFNKFRTPEMWLMLTVFCFTIPAMDGLQWVTDKAGQINTLGRTWIITAGLAILIGVLFFIATPSLLSFDKPGEREQLAQQIAAQNQVSPQDPRVAQTVERVLIEQFIPERVAVAKSDALRYTIISISVIGIVYLVLSSKIGITIALILIILISMYDMISVNKRYLGEYAYQDKSFTIERVIERQRRSVDTWVQNAITTDEPWTYRVFPLSDNPFNNAVPSYFYPSIGGYSGAKLGIFQDVVDEALFTGPIGINKNVLSLLNTKYILYNTPIPGFQVVHQSDGLNVLENPGVLPKAFFVDDIVVARDASEAMNFLLSESNDFRQVAVVQDVDQINTQADSLASVQITTYNAHEISMNVVRSTPGFLVISEMYYPDGWKAYLNGEPITIIRTNYLLRGVEVPTGNHELTMRYEPSWYPVVRATSTGSNILILILLAFVGYQYRGNLLRTGKPNTDESFPT